MQVLNILVLVLCIAFVHSEVIEATSLQQAEDIIKGNTNTVTGILFLDSTQVDATIDRSNGQEGSSGFFASIRGMFSNKGKSVYKYAEELGESIKVIEVDTSSTSLNEIKTLFNVTTVPYLVLVYKNQILFSGVPTRSNTNEIYDIINRSDELISLTPEQGGPIHFKNVPQDIVRINADEVAFKPSSKDDPFYFGDNDPTYDQALYRNPMNGGLISKSDRIPGVQSNQRVVERKVNGQSSTQSKPYDRLSLVKDITYYNDYLTQDPMKGHPEPIRVEIEKVPEVIVEDTPTVKNEIEINHVRPIKIELFKKEDPLVTQEVVLNKITPVKIPQSQPKPEPPLAVKKVELNKVTPVKIPQRQPRPVAPAPPPKPIIVYHDLPPQEPFNPAPVYIQPSRIVTVQEVIPVIQPIDTEEVDTKWQKVLEDEEVMIQRINQLYDEDLELSEKIKISEEAIKDSEEMFKKAKKDIDSTIQSSEEKMREYELKLAELYAAREMALKARESLYKPCTSCSTSSSETVIEKRLVSGPQRVVRRRMPADQSNFHDLYESAKHSARQGDKQTSN